MKIHEILTGFGALTVVIRVNGQNVVSVDASADVVYDFKVSNGISINRLLRYLAITEYRRLYR